MFLDDLNTGKNRKNANGCINHCKPKGLCIENKVQKNENGQNAIAKAVANNTKPCFRDKIFRVEHSLKKGRPRIRSNRETMIRRIIGGRRIDIAILIRIIVIVVRIQMVGFLLTGTANLTGIT